MSYVKGDSWHRVLSYTRMGAILTRCGRLVEGPEHQLVESLPLHEKSCESCLRLAAHDGEIVVPDVAEDEVADAPDVDTGEVPA